MARQVSRPRIMRGMKLSKRPASIGLSVCSFELSGGSVPTEVKLFPAGLFRSRDGRPEKLPGWVMDETVAARLLPKLAALAGDIVIDYEHQTLNAEANGQPAPAAGWIKGARAEWRPDGLWATDVDWTNAAKARIAAAEYRYLSPVFEFDQASGEVTSLLMMALTNFPGIDGHGDLAKAAALKFCPNQEDDSVKRDELIELLGLKPEATDEQISQGLATLKAKADRADALSGEVVALKGQVADPTKYVPIAMVDDLKKEVVALKGKINDGEVQALIDGGIDAGKLLPVQVEWARGLGKQDVAALRAYIDATPAIPGLAGSQTAGNVLGGDPNVLSGEQIAVCKAIGMSHNDFKAALKAREVAQ